MSPNYATHNWCVCVFQQDWDYPDMARIAAKRAMDDACIDYKEVEQVYVHICLCVHGDLVVMLVLRQLHKDFY